MEVSSGHDRVAELHHRLVYETDGMIRAGLHLELATLAVADGRFEHAARHFREALLLDGRLDHARDGLAALGEKLNPPSAPQGRLRGLLSRFRRKAA